MKTKYWFYLTSLLLLILFLALPLLPAQIYAAQQVCSDGTCASIVCNTNSDCGTNRFTGSQFCTGLDIYQEYTSYVCNNPGTAQSYCITSKTTQFQQTCQEPNQTCKSGKCIGTINSTPSNSTSTYQNSYSDQAPYQYQEPYQYQYPYSNPEPTYYQYSMPNYCAPFATKKCISNISYWHDSCGALQDIYQNCNITGQICSNGQCIAKPQPAPTSIKHHSTKCYNNDIYWYSSDGTLQDIYQKCQDDNSCTIDACQENACKNTLSCDGSTCATSSQDYSNYCKVSIQDGSNQNQALSITLLAKKQSDTDQWSKEIQANSNDSIDFLITFKNNSAASLNTVSIKTDLSSNLAFTGNLKIDNTSSGGNIANGIPLGTITPGMTKILSFSASIQPQNTTENATVMSTAYSGNSSNSDSLTIAIATQETQKDEAGNTFIDFLKKWYIWFFIIIILIVLFIIIFRRLSTDR